MNKKNPPIAWPDWFYTETEMYPAVEQMGWRGKRHVRVDSWEDAESLTLDLKEGRRTFKDVFGSRQ